MSEIANLQTQNAVTFFSLSRKVACKLQFRNYVFNTNKYLLCVETMLLITNFLEE